MYDGSFHDVDSDQLSFELCAQIAFKTAAKQANAKFAEPIIGVVITPEENMGDVIGDLNEEEEMLKEWTVKV